MTEGSTSEAPVRRRRPNLERTAQTRHSILAAALQTFLEAGFNSTRMADVAERAGLAKGTLYLHFTDKEALFEGVLSQAVRDLVSSMYPTQPGPDEGFRAFLTRTLLPVLQTLESSGTARFVRLVSIEAARSPALAALYRRHVIDPGYDLLQRMAARAVQTGELTTDGLVRFPMLLTAPVVVATIWNGSYARDAPIDIGAMFEAELDLIFSRSARPQL